MIDSYSALVTQTVLVDGHIRGLREIDSCGSILRVRAAPFSQRDRIVSLGDLTYITYLVDVPQLYTGHGKADRKIGDRLAPEALEQAQVYVICSLDPRFDKDSASYIEARLIQIAHDLGVPLTNERHPYGHDGLRICPNREQLVVHAEALLIAASFRRFDDARQADPDRRFHVAATADLHDVRVIPPNDLTIPGGAKRKRLVHKTLQAEGYWFDGRFVVLPGADYCTRTKSGVSPDNRRRREAIGALDIFEELPGVTDRLRLCVGLDCKSPPIAAKVITGEHLNNSAWETVSASTEPPEAPTMAASKPSPASAFGVKAARTAAESGSAEEHK
ncbi:MAG: hypothetical protein ACRECV_09620 [Xanthobacteraceae bacterium]